jgi:hypothetical protein
MSISIWEWVHLRSSIHALHRWRDVNDLVNLMLLPQVRLLVVRNQLAILDLDKGVVLRKIEIGKLSKEV